MPGKARKAMLIEINKPLKRPLIYKRHGHEDDHHPWVFHDLHGNTMRSTTWEEARDNFAKWLCPIKNIWIDECPDFLSAARFAASKLAIDNNRRIRELWVRRRWNG